MTLDQGDLEPITVKDLSKTPFGGASRCSKAAEETVSHLTYHCDNPYKRRNHYFPPFLSTGYRPYTEITRSR